MTTKADLSRPGLPHLLTTAEAAAYLRFRSTSGIRTAVLRGELAPAGAGPKRAHLFTQVELDRFVVARAARYFRRCSRETSEQAVPRKARQPRGRRAEAQHPHQQRQAALSTDQAGSRWGIREIVDRVESAFRETTRRVDGARKRST